jgi:tetratricopeptide (TPR) repeat protein
VSDFDKGSASLKGNLAVCCEHYGDVLLSQGEITDALSEYEEERKLLEDLQKLDEANVGVRVNQARNLMRIGEAQRLEGHFTEAIVTLNRSLQDHLALENADPARAIHRRNIAICRDRLTVAYLSAGKLGDAQNSARKYFEMMKELAEKEPDSIGAKRDLGIAYGRLGDVEFECRNFTAVALILWKESFELAKLVVDQDPSNGQALEDLAIAYERLARGFNKTGPFEACLERTVNAAKNRQMIYDVNPDSVAANCELIYAKLLVGDRHFARGKFPTAKTIYREAQELAASSAGQPSTTLEDRASRELKLRLALFEDDSYELAQVETVVSKLKLAAPRALKFLIESHLNRNDPGSAAHACRILAENATSVDDLFLAASLYDKISQRDNDAEVAAKYKLKAKSILAKAIMFTFARSILGGFG